VVVRKNRSWIPFALSTPVLFPHTSIRMGSP
jgi:hypothetical protein